MTARFVRRLLPKIRQLESCIPSVYSQSSLYTHNLMQGVHDLNQISLGRHPGFDRFVRGRSFVDHVGVLPALHAGGHALVICYRESPLCLSAGHGATRTVAAGLKTLRISLAAHDKGTSAHAARDDAHIALASANRAFSSNQNVFTVVRLSGYVIVVAVDRLQFRDERRN